MKNKLERTFTAGVDEVGRGCLAGPVLAAAVILKKKLAIPGDSKALSISAREIWYKEIVSNAYWAIGISSVEEIDVTNILKATLIAMERALEKLEVKPTTVLIDGKDTLHNLENYREVRTIISGDKIYEEIKAASIVAKITRDKIMQELDSLYPSYGWSFNKGYGTKKHLEALTQYGATPHHRKTFAPVKRVNTNEVNS